MGQSGIVYHHHPGVAADAEPALHAAANPSQLTTLAALASPTFSLDHLMAAVTEDAVHAIPTLCHAELKIFRDGATLCQGRDGGLASLSRAACRPKAGDPNAGDRQVNIPILRSGLRCGHFLIRTPYPFEVQPADLQTAHLLAAAVVAGLDRLEGDEAQRRFQSTFVHAPMGIAHVAVDGRFLLANDEFVRITATPRDELLTHGFQKITHPDDLDADSAHVQSLLNGEADQYKMDKRYIKPNGEIVRVRLKVGLIRTKDGAPDFFVSVIEEID